MKIGGCIGVSRLRNECASNRDVRDAGTSSIGGPNAMHGPTPCTTISPPRGHYAQPSNLIISVNMAPIDDALKALGSQKTPNYAEYARIYKVDRSTLLRRYRGVTGNRRDRNEKNSLLIY